MHAQGVGKLLQVLEGPGRNVQQHNTVFRDIVHKHHSCMLTVTACLSLVAVGCQFATPHVVGAGGAVCMHRAGDVRVRTHAVRRPAARLVLTVFAVFAFVKRLGRTLLHAHDDNGDGCQRYIGVVRRSQNSASIAVNDGEHLALNGQLLKRLRLTGSQLVQMVLEGLQVCGQITLAERNDLSTHDLLLYLRTFTTSSA